MQIYRLFVICLISITSLLTGCANGSIFGSTSDEIKDMDNMLTRVATKSEDQILDKCLHHIFNRQKYTYMKHGKYLTVKKHLNTYLACDDNISITMDSNERAYLINAIMNDGKEKVHYSMNHTGEVYEHNDMGFSDPDIL